MENILKKKKGDILLIKYNYDPMGWIIRKWTHSQFNHSAWVLNQNQILESGRYGTSIHSIKKYSNKFFYKCEVVRLIHINKKDLKEAINIAINSTKKRNYFKQLWTFILLACKYEGLLPRPTCSGLIAQALYKVDCFRFNYKSPSRITPGDIYESKYTRTI